jgi:hypothetical protein
MHLHPSIPDRLRDTLLLFDVEHLREDVQLHQSAVSLWSFPVFLKETLSEVLQHGQVAVTSQQKGRAQLSYTAAYSSQMSTTGGPVLITWQL